MANQGAKKRRDENQRHMTKLLRLIAICNGTYILMRMLILHSSFTWKHWIGLFVTSVAYALPYLQLSNMAQPSYDENRELLDGGFDMSTGGICGYLHDVIYITSFVQLGSIISDKFWYAYLVFDDKSSSRVKTLLLLGRHASLKNIRLQLLVSISVLLFSSLFIRLGYYQSCPQCHHSLAHLGL